MDLQELERKRSEVQSAQTIPLSTVALQLQAEADKNPVFNSIAHIFAMRERTRQQITVHSLEATLKKEGFSYTKDQLRQVLGFMAKARLGRLQMTSRGKIAALVGITYTLQSIGLASLRKNIKLDKNYPPIPFKKLPLPLGPSLPTAQGSTESAMEKRVIVDSVLKKPMKEDTLIIKIGHKTINFDLFPENKLNFIIDAIDKVYSEKQKKGG